MSINSKQDTQEENSTSTIVKTEKTVTYNKDSSTFCVLPWTMLQTDSIGTIRICCKSTEFLHSEKENLNNFSLKQAWQSEKLQSIRDNLNNDVKDDNCIKCWKEESSGAKSMRTSGSRYFYLLDNDLSTPQILDLKLGTKCNLKCRICSRYSSSLWSQEEEYFADNNLKDKINRETTKFLQAYNDDSTIWQDIDNWLPHLKKMEFYGGEPFLIDKNWEVLEKSIANGYNKYQELHYTTNGTTYRTNHIELLKQFNKVDIQLSIDDIENRFEYQRHPARWKVLDRNITKFKDLKNSIRHYNLTVCTTVSSLNIWYLDKLLEYFYNQNINVIFNILHGPSEFCISNLPISTKNKIEKKLLGIEKRFTNMSVHCTIDSIINFMYNSYTDEYDNFIQKLARHDVYRKENYIDNHYEFTQNLPNFVDKYQNVLNNIEHQVQPKRATG